MRSEYRSSIRSKTLIRNALLSLMAEKPFDKMTIRYGEPMDFSNRSKDELDEITEEIMEKILELAK